MYTIFSREAHGTLGMIFRAGLGLALLAGETGCELSGLGALASPGGLQDASQFLQSLLDAAGGSDSCSPDWAGEPPSPRP